MPHGEYRVGTGPHARQSWGAGAPVSRPGPPPRPRRQTGSWTECNVSELSAGAGQVNEGRGSNKRGRRRPVWCVFVDGGPRGVFGGLCRANVVELTRGGAGGVPLDTTRSTLVSYLFVGEVPGDGPAG